MGENKMGIMPMPKLMLTMSLPAILSMMVQALYNIVDSMFVSRIGEEALTAVSLAFPIQIIIIACFLGIGTGVNSLISRKIGEKDLDSAVSAAEHGFILSGILYLIIVIVGIFFSDHFFSMFTEDVKILNYGTDYIRIIMFFSFGRLFAQSAMSTLQGTGEMVQPMIAQLIGAILNIILDPILIFGLLGFPAMGVRGAAIATVTAQIISMIYIMTQLFRRNTYIKVNLKKFKYSSSITKQIVVVGLPVAIMQGLASLMISGLNLVLAGFDETAVAVMGVYFRLQSLVFMPIFGLAQGTMPIIGYNFGARNKNRLINALKIGIGAAFILTTIGMLLFQLLPVKLLSLFNSSLEMTEIGVVAFRIISLGFPMAAVSIMLSISFQGMGDSYISLIVSFTRQIIVLLPAAYIFGRFGGLNSVWFGFLFSEVVALIMVVYFFKEAYRTKLLPWDDDVRQAI
ncbi:MAG: MATE family efflux transporter [Clostridia bacterium]|nr:MATE family efflux transporter [Clostridia bacterium]